LSGGGERSEGLVVARARFGVEVREALRDRRSLGGAGVGEELKDELIGPSGKGAGKFIDGNESIEERAQGFELGRGQRHGVMF
jgi:hypothetical protein